LLLATQKLDDIHRRGTTLRRPALAAVAAGVLVLAAGCGSSTHTAGPPPPPKLPYALAHRLASESDAVAAALAEGGACSAQAAGRELRSDATASIGRVPVRLQEPLSSGVNAVVASLPECVPATPAPAAPKEHPHHEPGPKPKPPGKQHDKTDP
jgi:hypothetical protein